MAQFQIKDGVAIIPEGVKVIEDEAGTPMIPFSPLPLWIG